MDITPYVPVIVEATKFLFTEASHWLSLARKRVNEPKVKPAPRDPVQPGLTEKEFNQLLAEPQKIQPIIDLEGINPENAEMLEYEIRSLVDMIRTHRKNILDYEKTEALYGDLVPLHIRRGIERESMNLIEKSERLKALLEKVYGQPLAAP
jgi:hypothetical protein